MGNRNPEKPQTPGAAAAPAKKKLNATSGDIFRMLAHESRRHQGLFWLMVAGSAGIQAANLIQPLFLKQFFNFLAQGSPTPAVIHAMFVIILWIAAIFAVGWVFRRMQMYGIINFESRAMVDLYDSAFTYLLGHSHDFFSSHFGGTLTRRVSKYAGSFETLMDSIMMEFFPMAIFVVGAVWILALRNLWLGLVLGAWVVVFVGFQIFVARVKQPLRVERSEADSKLVGVLADDIGNQTAVTLFSGVAYERGLFGGMVNAWHRATMRSWRADEAVWAVQDVLIVSINIALFFVAFWLWQKGSFSVGDFVLMQSYLLGIFNQLSSINRIMRRCYDAIADASEMIDIMKTPHAIADRPLAASLAVSRGEIAFRGVDFAYPNGKRVLRNLDLTIAPGEKVAFVGASGAGKSTITKLILRLYDVSKGEVAIDGQNVAGVTQDSLHDAIAFVPQEPVLFHRSLMENIRYGRRDATDEEVKRAAALAHCDDFINALRDGYETFVGERGIKLSGGERQRIAIARAILKNAPILLLDEATSSLDSESEHLIQDALKVLMEGKTVAVIAHRLSTIMNMDRIVVVDGGAVVAQGTHDELLRKEGIYKKLWSIQAGGFLPA